MTGSDPLRDVLARYAALREHDDQNFASRLITLRRWQASALRRRHPETLREPAPARLIDFFIEEFYCGVDLSELTTDIDASVSRIRRLLPDTRAAGAALELITLAGELDQALCEALEVMPGERIWPLEYARAYRQVGREADRLRLLRLIEDICDELAGFARSRIAFMAFKLAGVPARRAGLGSLYELNYGAFDVARHVKDLPGLVNSLLCVEEQQIKRIFTA